MTGDRNPPELVTGSTEQAPHGPAGFPPAPGEFRPPGGPSEPGEPGEAGPGPAGFAPPAGHRPPFDQHHEHVPRTGPGLGSALRARAAFGRAGPGSDRRWSMLAYLGMIFFQFLPPLAVYLIKRRESRFVRYHAAQALNLWITSLLYTLSCLIISGLLALDTTGTALAVGIPLTCLVWASAVAYAVAGAMSAARGRQRELPGWVCSPMVK